MELVLRPAGRQDAAVLAAIYNSNPEFLLHHLGRDRVDKAFLLSELEEMAGAGFVTLLITQGRDGPALAAADVRDGEEAYLSLLILHRDAQGHGRGRQCAALLEEHCAPAAAAGCASTWWTTTPAIHCPSGGGWATKAASGWL